MPWQIPLILRVCFAHIAVPVFMKKVVGLPSRTRRLRAQFLFCSLFSVLIAFAFRSQFVVDKRVLFIVAIGVMNSFACYSQWRAVDMSLSKTSLLTQADDLIALALAALILHEGRLVTAVLGVGIVLCIGAGTAYSFISAQSKKASGNATDAPWKILVWIGTYSVIWGVAVFAMRFVAVKGLSLPNFLCAWYGGSFLGSLIVFRLMGAKEAGAPLDRHGVSGMVFFSFLIWASMVFSFLATQRAPVAIVQPIVQVTEMVFPTIIGLWWFKEGKQLDWKGKSIFAAGLAGSLVLIFFFRGSP